MVLKVDGDTSTNNTVIALASGLSGSPFISSLKCTEAAQLQAYLLAIFLTVVDKLDLTWILNLTNCPVMQGLAKSIAWDGEGATCLIEVTVKGTETEAEAAKIARSVASSSLVKAAVYGRDPNWGRIAAAAGYGTVTIDLSVGEGAATGKAWGCDLSYDYVKINAEYTS